MDDAELPTQEPTTENRQLSADETQASVPESDNTEEPAPASEQLITVEEPIINEEPATKDPTTNGEPTADELAMTEPAVEEPVTTEEPTAEEEPATTEELPTVPEGTIVLEESASFEEPPITEEHPTNTESPAPTVEDFITEAEAEVVARLAVNEDPPPSANEGPIGEDNTQSIEGPATDEAAVEKAAIEEPTVEEPTVEEPVAEEPAVANEESISPVIVEPVNDPEPEKTEEPPAPPPSTPAYEELPQSIVPKRTMSVTSPDGLPIAAIVRLPFENGIVEIVTKVIAPSPEIKIDSPEPMLGGTPVEEQEPKTPTPPQEQVKPESWPESEHTMSTRLSPPPSSPSCEKSEPFVELVEGIAEPEPATYTPPLHSKNLDDKEEKIEEPRSKTDIPFPNAPSRVNSMPLSVKNWQRAPTEQNINPETPPTRPPSRKAKMRLKIPKPVFTFLVGHEIREKMVDMLQKRATGTT